MKDHDVIELSVAEKLALLGFVLLAELSLCGYVLNIIMLSRATHDAYYVWRCIGVFVFPLGTVMGYVQ